MAIALDTLAYARRLREAGFSEQQAEGGAEALASIMTDMLATKVDLQALGTKQDLQDAVRGLATKDELRDAVRGLATKDELRDAVRGLATKDELRDAVRGLATKDELRDLEARMDRRLDEKFLEADRREQIRFDEHTAKFDARLADLERRMTMRLGGMMAAGIAFLSAFLKMT